jgi:TolB protein
MKTLLRNLGLLLIGLLLFQARAHAVLTIEITQGVEGALPLAVVPFSVAPGGAAPTSPPSSVRTWAAAAASARCRRKTCWPAPTMPPR